jgi:hypothetical protein
MGRSRTPSRRSVRTGEVVGHDLGARDAGVGIIELFVGDELRHERHHRRVHQDLASDPANSA